MTCDNCGKPDAALRVCHILKSGVVVDYFYCGSECRSQKWTGAEDWPDHNTVVCDMVAVFGSSRKGGTEQ